MYITSIDSYMVEKKINILFPHMGAFHLDSPMHCSCSMTSNVIKHKRVGRLARTNVVAISGKQRDLGFPKWKLFYTFTCCGPTQCVNSFD